MKLANLLTSELDNTETFTAKTAKVSPVFNQNSLSTPFYASNNDNKAFSGTNFTDFLGKRESNNNYKATNKHSSATGKYQFLWGKHGDKIMQQTGVKSQQEFLNNPKAQEDFMQRYWNPRLQAEADTLKPYNKKNMSTSQLKALVHFKGLGGARKYLAKGVDDTQANNMPIENYLPKFKKGGKLPKYNIGGASGLQGINEVANFLAKKKVQDFSGLSAGLGMGSTLLDSLNDAENPKSGISALSGAAKGAAAGLAFGGVGALVGGTLGLTTALIQSNKLKKEQERKRLIKQGNFNQSNLNKSTAVQAMFDNRTIDNIGMYDKGGEVEAEYEAEKGEIITGDAQLENAKQIAQGVQEIGGNKHEQGGTKGAGGDFIFSDSIKATNNKTFANIAKSIALKKAKNEKILNGKSTDYIFKNTATGNVTKANAELEQLAQMQEMYKQQAGIKNNKMQKFGGLIKMSLGGDIEELIKKGYTKEQATGIVNRRQKLFNFADNVGIIKGDKVTEAVAKQFKGQGAGFPTKEQLVKFDNWTKKEQPTKYDKTQSLNSIYSKFGMNATTFPEVVVKAKKSNTNTLDPFKETTSQGEKFYKDANGGIHFKNRTGVYKDDGKQYILDRKQTGNISKSKNGIKDKTTGLRKSVIPKVTTTTKKATIEAPKIDFNVIDTVIDTPKTNLNEFFTKFNKAREKTGIIQDPKLQVGFQKPDATSATTKVGDAKTDNMFDKAKQFLNKNSSMLGIGANYLANNNVINKMNTDVVAPVLEAPMYNYYDRSGTAKNAINSQFNTLNKSVGVNQTTKQVAFANSLDELNKVGNQEAMRKDSYDNEFLKTANSIKNTNTIASVDAENQRITNNNIKLGLKSDNLNNTFSNIRGVQQQNRMLTRNGQNVDLLMRPLLMRGFTRDEAKKELGLAKFGGFLKKKR